MVLLCSASEDMSASEYVGPTVSSHVFVTAYVHAMSSFFLFLPLNVSPGYFPSVSRCTHTYRVIASHQFPSDYHFSFAFVSLFQCVTGALFFLKHYSYTTSAIYVQAENMATQRTTVGYAFIVYSIRYLRIYRYLYFGKSGCHHGKRFLSV